YPEALFVPRVRAIRDIPEDVLRDSLAALVAEEEVIRESAHTEEPWIYSKRLWHAERQIAEELVALMREPHPLPALDVEKAARWVESKMGVELADEQREAIRQAATQKVLVVTGGPGVGKTTLVRGILDVFRAKNLRVALAAPTGRAARRLSEST